MNKLKGFVVVGLIGLLVAAGAAVAQEGHEGHDHKGEGPEHGNPEFAAEMEAWMKMANPGDHHDHLAKLVGTWDATVKMWMAPDAPPQESQAKSVTELVLGGRFLKTNHEGDFMGQPFHGIGMDGYDNIAKKHVGTWMDTASTHVLQFVGSCKDNGRVLSMTSEQMAPGGTVQQTRGVTTIVSDDKYMYEMFTILPGGEEIKGFEIVYTRQ